MKNLIFRTANMIAILALVAMPVPVAFAAPQASVSTFTDHQAVVTNVILNVKILRHGEDQWAPLSVGEIIKEGDQVRTAAGASVDISYDDSYMNLASIGENTFAEFRSIEATDIYLTNGSIFNSLESLPKGSTYEVVTATAVNGIRGTEFLRSYDAFSGVDITIVSKGVVETLKVMPNGKLDPRLTRVRAGESLKLSAGKDFHATKPVAHSKGDKGLIRASTRSVEKALAKFVGGKGNLTAKRKAWNSVKVKVKIRPNVDPSRAIKSFGKNASKKESQKILRYLKAKKANGNSGSQGQGQGKGQNKGKGN